MQKLRIQSKRVSHALHWLCSSSRIDDIFTSRKTAGLHEAIMQKVFAGLGIIKGRSDRATQGAEAIAKWKELTNG